MLQGLTPKDLINWKIKIQEYTNKETKKQGFSDR